MKVDSKGRGFVALEQSLANNRLTVGMTRKIGLLGVVGTCAVGAVAISDTVLVPDVAVVAVVVGGIIGVVAGSMSTVEGIIGGRLLVVSRGISIAVDGAVKPLIVVVVDRSSRVDILWCAIARIRGGQRSRVCRVWPRLRVDPSSLFTPISLRLSSLVVLAARETLITLKLGNLPLVPCLQVRVTWTRDISLDGRDQSSQTLASCLGLLSLLGLLPLLPVCQPGLVVLTLIKIDVENPRDRPKPLIFHSVQFANRDPTDFGPGLVLERIVVEELAAKQKRNGEHPPDLAFCVVVLAGSVHHVDTLREVVETE